MNLSEHVADLAAKLAGNHRKFESFGWSERPEDDQQWCIVYTSNRDANALTRSNARVIAKALDAFSEDDCRAESHSHWACGHVDGYAIRVYDAAGNVTPAFTAYAELVIALEDYPVLDDEDFSAEEEEEANEVWKNCYRDSERLEYIRANRSQFEFHDFADLLGSVRGRHFGGYASELLS